MSNNHPTPKPTQAPIKHPAPAKPVQDENS